jgi:outer membrane lipoprotein LolB
MRMFNRINIILLSTLMILNGCQLTPPADTTPTIAHSWEEQQHNLSPLIYWNIAGKLGIKTKDESHSTLINWQQQKDRYAIAITSPLGTSVAHIDSNGRTVTLTLSEDEIYKANSLDDLLWNQLGWWLPADHLFYWIRGLPAPTVIDHQQLNEQHQLVQLKQSGWKIDYLDYMTADGFSLPKKIVLENPELKLTLFISEWHIAKTALTPP